eukprot:GHVL01011925.1.p1 GENE.GHVL01011925.1~~GHVL01011925.1.p1  ORF type:complete len:350 (-),score=94.73 GHVL01011925.1:625-1674(-)
MRSSSFKNPDDVDDDPCPVRRPTIEYLLHRSQENPLKSSPPPVYLKKKRDSLNVDSDLHCKESYENDLFHTDEIRYKSIGVQELSTPLHDSTIIDDDWNAHYGSGESTVTSSFSWRPSNNLSRQSSNTDIKAEMSFVLIDIDTSENIFDNNCKNNDIYNKNNNIYDKNNDIYDKNHDKNDIYDNKNDIYDNNKNKNNKPPLPPNDIYEGGKYRNSSVKRSDLRLNTDKIRRSTDKSLQRGRSDSDLRGRQKMESWKTTSKPITDKLRKELYQGYLLKKHPRQDYWQRRWVKLQNGILVYCGGPRGSAKGVIEFYKQRHVFGLVFYLYISYFMRICICIYIYIYIFIDNK